MSERARGTRALLLAGLAVAVAGPVTAASAVGPARTAAPTGSACSWLGEQDQRDVNIGAPDLDAYYYLSPLVPRPGLTYLVHGYYPQARYFSFHVYTGSLQAVDSLYDQRIAPDRGSTNPFLAAPAPGSGDRYTLSVVVGPVPAHPARNTLYLPSASSAGSALPALVYRIYVPKDAAQPDGSVPMPQISVTSGGRTLATEGACVTSPPPFGSVLWQLVASADYPQGAPAVSPESAPATPTWSRSFGNQFGNMQNAYLTADISRKYGQLVVIHTLAPTFPNTSAGQPVYGRYQVRYWSICSYDGSGEAVIGCAADYHAAIRDGWITYVISDPADRPVNATAANGVTWLPWGGTDATAQLVYRNMLPSASFTHAVQDITTSTTSAQQVMGPYYPAAAYCSAATFSAGGWQACFSTP